ncbi:hypothetical protein [Streptomyces griseorubiginosus]|nr:hypothetical protein [Streptomyces griseorubiginosus]WUB42975.1 hypothetical protein OHN19_06355 [Streptomyces griseorubiginosus]WUB51493.1 hypothetical protein OG942_06350 [Streptomyces griseorubiginosus]
MLTAPLIQGVGIALPALASFIGVCTLALTMAPLYGSRVPPRC